MPQTPGDWRYSAAATGSIARFGESASEPLFAIECDRRGRMITLVRTGTFPTDAPVTVHTTTGSRALSAAPAGDGRSLRAALSPSDPTLDAMAFSRGRFAFEVTGAPTLHIPSWPEITRVVEDCR